MPFQLTHPAYLLLLPPLVAAGWWVGRASLANLSRTRGLVANGVRLVVLLLLTLALAGFQVVHTNHSLCTVFVMDVSASIPRELQKAALSYLGQACKQMRKGDTAALVVFGSDAYIELPASAAPKISRIYSRPSTSYSDLASALRLALATFPPGVGRQIVLLSDGNENLGSAIDQALMCKASGVRISAVPLRQEVGSEALLEHAALPAEVKQGEPFEVKIVAMASTPAQGRLRIFRNGEYLGAQRVSLLPGKSVLTVPQSVEKPGFYTYEAMLEVGPDAMTENNRALAFVRVQGKPQVLVLAGLPDEARYLEQALSSHDITVKVQGLSGIPTSLNEWRRWDAVVFADVPAVALTPEQMLMVQSYVRDLGGGFGMLGGEEGFGAGGYFRTPVEETLPVDMAIRKQKVFPSLAVVLIMDTSGSSGTPIDGRQMIALEAESAVRVVETMQSIDQIGAIVSGEGVDVIAPIRYAKEKEALINDLRRMRPGGGGIFCRPSMEAAYQMMKGVNARTRHIIMLADGGDCDEQAGCDAIAAAMKREKMTFSTVSFGLGPHSAFLERVAQIGGGSFYLATRATDLPRIFTKDAMLASKSLMVEEPFKPKAEAGAEILRGLDLSTMPPLLGYVATTPKSLASVPMETHKDDPLLATWRYGLGRSLAFTSDAQARWAAHWLGWPGYGKFWSQAVRWMLQRGRPSGWNVTAEESRGEGTVTVEAVDREGEFENFLDLDAHLVGPDLKPNTLHLEQVAPGRYSTHFPVREVGAHLVTVTRRGDSSEASPTTGVVVPYPPEYRDLKPNDYLLNQLAQSTGGRVDPAPESIYGGKREAARYPQDMWLLLVLLAALLWPVDVAARRLVIEAQQVAAAAARARVRARQAWQSLTGPARLLRDPTVARLLRSSQQRKAGAEPPPAAERLEPRPAPSETPVAVGAPRATEPRPHVAPAARPAEEEPAAEGGDPLSRLKAAKRRARREGS
jgi:uncharacterized membrane protein